MVIDPPKAGLVSKLAPSSIKRLKCELWIFLSNVKIGRGFNNCSCAKGISLVFSFHLIVSVVKMQSVNKADEK